MLRRVLVGVAAPMRMSMQTTRSAVVTQSVRAFATAKKGKPKVAAKAAPKKKAAAAGAKTMPPRISTPLVPQDFAKVGEFPKLKTEQGPYAKSLFDVGVQLDYTLEPGKNNFRMIVSTFKLLNKTETFNKVFQNPLIPKEAKFDFLKHTHKGMSKYLKDGLHPVVLRFLQLLIAKNDEKLLPLVIADIDMLVDWANRRVPCEITSAEPLSAAQVTALETKVKSIRDSAESLDFKYTVDAKLLGGLKVMVGDEVADMSVATRLDNFHNTLRNSSRDGQ